MEFSEQELHLIRQWFDSVQDTNSQYLERPDYMLARRLYGALDMRLPDSIRNNS